MVNHSSGITPYGATCGTYLKLIPQFSEIVDYYIYTKDNEGIHSLGSILKPANYGTIFLFYLQNNKHISLEDVSEEEVIHFFIKDGQPYRSYYYRYGLSDFLCSVSDKYPACTSLDNWLPLIRITRKNIQYFTEEEIIAIKEVLLSESSRLTYRDKAIGLILLYTGLRGCDIASLKLENIDWQKEIITLDQSKTDVEVVIPLHVHVGNAIYDYLIHERESDLNYLFIDSYGNVLSAKSLRENVNKIYKAAGIRQNKGDRRGTHLFRHHLVTAYLKNGVPQPVITRAAGHSNPASDEAYFGSDIEHLRRCALSIEEYPLDWDVFDHA